MAALFTHERIRTTDVKAKATRRLAERTITWARRLGETLTKTPERRSDDERARVVHAVRMARRVVRNRDAVLRLFEEIGPRYLSRPGGYTRIIKLGQRPGDAAPMSLLELIPADGAPAPATKKGEGAAPEGKGKGKAKPAAEAAPAKKGSKAEKPASTAKARVKADQSKGRESGGTKKGKKGKDE